MSIKYVFILGCAIVFIISISAFIYRHNTIKSTNDLEYSIEKKQIEVNVIKRELKKNTNTDDKSSEDFYRTIVDNNIFRPLGWRPPKKEPEYTLIGTESYPDGNIAEAIILERRSKQLITVKVGETLGKVTVKEIKPKQVILDDSGKEIKLRVSSMKFLK